MPNSGDIKSLVIAMKAISIIPKLIYYNKLFVLVVQEYLLQGFYTSVS